MPRKYSMDNRAAAFFATRCRVLDAAIQVLAEAGVAGLTMQEVAKRSDVALRTVYNHFDSKEQLVAEAYARLAGFTQEAVRNLPPEGDPCRRVVRFVEAFYDSYAAQALGAAVIMTVTGIDELDRQLAAVRQWRRKQITEMLTEVDAAGRLLLPLDRAVALLFLWTAYVTYSSLADESGLGPQAAKDIAVASLSATLFGERQTATGKPRRSSTGRSRSTKLSK